MRRVNIYLNGREAPLDRYVSEEGRTILLDWLHRDDQTSCHVDLTVPTANKGPSGVRRQCTFARGGVTVIEDVPENA